jgi:FSR family fosmidomycin resistance protein-like MFS transporter
VLIGGWIADRTHQHHLVVAICFVLIALFSAAVPLLLPPVALVAILFACTGLFSGVVAPSRDMMVRQITPAGSSGRVFGFVTIGLNIGGVLGPMLFGLVLDWGEPGHLFWTIAVLSLLTLIVIFASARQGEPEAVPASR